ncbi:MAG: chloride channel protein [Atopobiaceae bacterium]|nr:chloride channel protein [Atopobiaceae bacterium]
MFDRSVHHQVEKQFSRRLQFHMVVEGLIVGIAAGATITLYRLALAAAETSLRQFVGNAAGNVVLMLVWALCLSAMLLMVILLVSWEPDAAGSGIPQTQAEIMGRVHQNWWRVIVAKFSAGTITALAGLSLGREGPSVQLGAMAGKGVAQALRREDNEERICVSCGAAAGMSAAFHAPLTGVMFALEEMHRSFNAPLIIAVMCSCVASDFLVSQVLGMSPVLELSLSGLIPLSSYLLVILLGILAGIFGAFHNTGMFLVKSLFDRLGSTHKALKLAVAFMLSGIVAFIFLCCRVVATPLLNCLSIRIPSHCL